MMLILLLFRLDDMKNIQSCNVFQLYRKTVSATMIQSVLKRQHLRVRTRIYPVTVVLWLMIRQRLVAPGTLATAVSARARGTWRGLLSDRKPRQKISLRTGGYCRARQRLPRAVMEQIISALTAALQQELRPPAASGQPPVYLLDGSSLQLCHRAELLQNYPPAANQHRRSHWPVMRTVMLHEARSGLALRPAWSAMYGPQSLSEQALAEGLLDQLPPGAVLIADRNFGIFHTAYEVCRRQRAVLVRLTQSRARRLGGRLIAGMDQTLVWKPSPWDRKMHPALPVDAAVEGRLVVCVLAGRREPLYLFTTLPLPASELVQLYGLRWNIETDLRALKRTVRLHRLTGNSVDIAEKEILAAVAAYNLIRTVMCLAARKAGADPRQMSFSQILCLVNEFWPELLAQTTPSGWSRTMDRIIRLAATCTLPKRHKRRAYPRQIWTIRHRYPIRNEKDSQSK
jgi:hypothetical protein